MSKRIEDELKEIWYSDQPLSATADIVENADSDLDNRTEYEQHMAKMFGHVFGDDFGSTATPEEKQALEYLATRFPETFQSIPTLQWELFKTLAVKNYNYGDQNITMGGDIYGDDKAMHFALVALSIRMNDKMQRFMNLVRRGDVGTSDETVLDTLRDMSNYALIGVVMLSEKWGR